MASNYYVNADFLFSGYTQREWGERERGTGRQAGRQAGRQTGRQADGQTGREWRTTLLSNNNHPSLEGKQTINCSSIKRPSSSSSLITTKTMTNVVGPKLTQHATQAEARTQADRCKSISILTMTLSPTRGWNINIHQAPDDGGVLYKGGRRPDTQRVVVSPAALLPRKKLR